MGPGPFGPPVGPSPSQPQLHEEELGLKLLNDTSTGENELFDELDELSTLLDEPELYGSSTLLDELELELELNGSSTLLDELSPELGG